MKLRIQGLKTVGKKIRSRKELREYVSYCLDKLNVSSRMQAALDISIKFDPRLKKDSDARGMCAYVDQSFRPREFEIEIDSTYGRRCIMESIAHELVHVHQYSTGMMQDIDRVLDKYKARIAKGQKNDKNNKLNTRWMGEYYSTSQVNYYDHPWEIDAHGREIGLYERFKHLMKTGKELRH